MNEQSFEFQATVDAPDVKKEPFLRAFPPAIGKKLGSDRDLGNVTCKEVEPRDNETTRLVVTMEMGNERVAGSIEIDFSRHASSISGRGKFTWHVVKSVTQGSRLVAALEKAAFVKNFQKRVAAAMQDALVVAGCIPAAAACIPVAQQEQKPFRCRRCDALIQPDTVKHGRCPHCTVKL